MSGLLEAKEIKVDQLIVLLDKIERIEPALERGLENFCGTKLYQSLSHVGRCLFVEEVVKHVSNIGESVGNKWHFATFEPYLEDDIRESSFVIMDQVTLEGGNGSVDPRYLIQSLRAGIKNTTVEMALIGKKPPSLRSMATYMPGNMDNHRLVLSSCGGWREN